MICRNVKLTFQGTVLFAFLLIGGFPSWAQDDSFESVYARGIQLARGGNSQQALQEFQKAAQLSPGNPKVHNMLGVVLTQLGRLKEANATYDRALSLAPDFLPARKNRAVNLFTLGDLKLSGREFEDLAKLQPKDYVPRLFLGLISIENRGFENAQRQLLDAEKLSPGNSRILLPLIRVEFILGERRAALEHARKMWTQLQVVDAERFQLGVLLAQFAANPEAAAVFRDLSHRETDSYEVTFNLALAEYQSGQFEGALRTINQYGVRAKLSGEMLNLQGWIYGKMRRLDQAIRSFRMAMEADPQNGDHYLDLSNALQNSADIDGAIQVVRQGIERRIDLDRLQVQLGLLYQKKGDPRQAESWFRQALATNTENRSAYLALALLMYQTNRKRESLELLKKALSVLPQDAFLYYLYGGQLLEEAETVGSGNLEEAMTVLNKALELNPLYANTYFLLGKLYAKKGDDATAESYFDKTCSFNPGHRGALWQLVLIARQQGKKEKVAELTQRMQRLQDQSEKPESDSFLGAVQDSLRSNDSLRAKSRQ